MELDIFIRLDYFQGSFYSHYIKIYQGCKIGKKFLPFFILNILIDEPLGQVNLTLVIC